MGAVRKSHLSQFELLEPLLKRSALRSERKSLRGRIIGNSIWGRSRATALSHMPRRRFKQTQTLEERLAAEAKRLREEAKKLKPEVEREALLRKTRQAETGSHVSEWLRSPNLQSHLHPW